MTATIPRLTASVTTTKPRQASLFISHVSYLSDRPGGVQRCTQEYQQSLGAAGFDLTLLSYETPRDPRSRLRRKLWPRPYEGRLPEDLVDRIVAAVQGLIPQQTRITLFFNQGDLAPLAQPLKQRLGSSIEIVLLSHGLESTDLFHGIRTRDPGQPFAQVSDRDRQTLSRSLIAEWQQRQWIDQIFCLSSFELELERWLGAKQVTWIPRMVTAQPLDWRPEANYLGFVGTLNHSPNREGLLLFLQALQPMAPAGLRLRLVGGPAGAGAEIARQFPLVDYLGALDDGELRQEASRWSAMVHPLFCYPRGCSTKLAVALGWQIPVLTTLPGCRGYRGAAERLLLANNPQHLAQLAVDVGDRTLMETLRQYSIDVVAQSPTLGEVASLMQEQLIAVSQFS